VSTVLQIVGSESGAFNEFAFSEEAFATGATVLFDFNDPTGANNVGVGSVRTELAIGGGFDLGVPALDAVILAAPSEDGGEVVHLRQGFGSMAWRQRIRPPDGATSPDAILSAVGALAELLSYRGVLKYVPNNSTETRFIDFEPSPTPGVFRGLPLELMQITELLDSPQGFEIQMVRQPYLRGYELAPETNLVSNPTLAHDFGGTSNRPDGWAWDSTTGITGETIVQVETGGKRRGAYQFTIADGGVHNLQQTTAASTVASGEVAPFSFYARVTGTALTSRARAMVEYMQADGTTQVGSDQSGTLTTLTTAWQRLSVTPAAAGALTSRVRVSLQIDNTDATSMTIQLCNTQAEIGAAPSTFRASAAAVNYNPASTALPRRVAVWCEGNAPSRARLQVTADATTLKRLRVYRVSEDAVAVLKATLHKSLRSGTLGTDTTSVADADGLDGNVAQVAYTDPDPAFGTDATASGAADTITISKPSSLAEGEFMLAHIYRRTSGTQIVAPAGWSLLGYSDSTTADSALFVWWKFADALDASASVSSYTFEVVYPNGGNTDYRAWIGRFTNIDTNSPVDAVSFTQENATTAATLADLTTSADDAMIVGIIGAERTSASGTVSFTAPTGTTPTYTEQDDGTATATWFGSATYTGVLATAGATGTKDVTVVASADTIMCHLALRKAPAALAARSTVTFSGTTLPAGEYDVFVRYRTTAACWDRVRVEYALRASPSLWTALPDFLVDTRAASTFSEYQEHLVGRLAVPEDRPLDTLTVRVSAGREITSSANMRLDAVILAPAFERVAEITAPTTLASGESLWSDARTGQALHLASDLDMLGVTEVAGPVPVELVPGFQVLYVVGTLGPLAGFTDPETQVSAAPTVAVTHTPRYRA